MATFYEVRLSRTVVQTATLVVCATNEEEAETEAWLAAEPSYWTEKGVEEEVLEVEATDGH